MPLPDRRTFLSCCSAAALLPGLRGQQPTTAARGLDELAELARRTDREQLLQQAVVMHRNGTSWRDLLGAAFLAGIRDVEPRPVGFQFHCVLVTSSAFEIAEAVPAAERLVPALFNLADFKTSQAIDRQQGDWVLPPAPEVVADDPVAARAALIAALDAGEAAAADRAATAFARCASLEAAFEVLWRYGVRDFADLGHNPIYVAQAHRTLQQIGWRHGEEVLRSLVHGLLDGKPGADDATFAPNRGRAAKLFREVTLGEPSLPASLALLQELRRASADGAAELIGKRLDAGMGLQAILDGLRLHAADLIQRAPGILSVHALTSIHALRFCAEHTRVEGTRKLLLLQAASWQVRYREFLGSRSGFAADLPGIETLAPAGTGDAAKVFATAGEAPLRAGPLALRAAADGGLLPLQQQLRHWLVRKAREHHDYKFAAALIEEMDLAHPEVASRMLAASLGYLCRPGQPDGESWKAATA